MGGLIGPDPQHASESRALPGLVRRYAQRALPGGSGRTEKVRIEQSGEMVLKPGARSRRFSAIEEFAVRRVEFAWGARFPMLGPVSMRVTDSYRSGQGILEVRLLGLPLQRRQGPELAQGEAYRYLAELAWVPHAILANAELDWRELDERTVEVASKVGGEPVQVRLVFDQAGDLVRTIADRPRAEAGNAVLPWIGEYGEYQMLGGVRLPTRGEVRWELPEGPFTYWRGTITSLEERD